MDSYVTDLRIKTMRRTSMRLSNRLIRLFVFSNRFSCINTNVYKCNTTNVVTKIQWRVLLIDVSDTSLYRLPSGFFVSVCLFRARDTLQPRLRESLVELDEWNACTSKYNRLPKSTRHLETELFPDHDWLNYHKIHEKGVYNVIYKIDKYTS